MKKLFLLITLISLSFLVYSQGYWEEVQDVAPFGALNECIFTDSNNGWAFGQRGIIQHTFDGGLNWDIQFNNPDRLFSSGSFLNENEGWIVGWGYILHTTDGGQNWILQARPTCMGDLTDVYFLDENNGWIVGWYTIILRTTDGGQTWEKISNQIAGGVNFNSVQFFDENNGVICGNNEDEAGVVWITNDGGLTWTETGPETTYDFLSLKINNLNEVFVCGSYGALFKSTDMGSTWIDKSIDYKNFYDIEFGENQTAYLLAGNLIYKSIDNGETWNDSIIVRSESHLRDINMGGEQMYGCGGNTSVYKIPEDGSDWVRLTYNNPLDFRKIEFVNNNDGFGIRGSSFIGQAVKTKDGGVTWYEDTIIPDQQFYHLASSNQTIYYLSKYNNLVKSIDGGQNWETIDISPIIKNAFFNDFSVPSENTLYLCNDSSVLFKSVDGGYNWDQITFTEYHKFTISYFYDDDFGWLVDDYTGKLWRTTDGGTSWVRKDVDEAHTYVPEEVYFINENVGFVITENGHIYRTTDGGNFWEMVLDLDSSVYPIFHFVSESNGYLINRDKIFFSEDAGLSWTEHQTLSGIAICADFSSTKSWIAGMYELMAVNDDILDVQNISLTNLSLKIYPNPAFDKISITTKIALQDATFDIYSISGRLISSNNSNINGKLDISNLPKGTYLLKVNTSETSVVEKFVKF